MMKKCILAALMLMTLVLTGCHGSQGMAAFTVPEEFDTSRNYEITFWAKSDTNKTQTAIYQKTIADFHEIYPNITVNLKIYTDYGRIYNDVITNIATNTTPNVCITYPDHIATYLTGVNTVVALDDLFSDPRYGLGGSEVRFKAPRFDQLIPQFAQEGKFSDHYYDIPFMRSSEALYINKTYVEKLGYQVPDIVTWDFIWEVSEAATAKDEEGNYLVNGQKVMIPFIYKSTDNMMIQMLRQKNAGYSTEDGEILIFNDVTRSLLYEIGSHVSSGAFSTFKISSYPANFLNAGQCIFAVDSTAGSTWMGSNAPLLDISEENVVDFETVVRPVPQYDTANPVMISQGPSICVFNKKDPQEVLASWLFAQYMLSNEVQISYSQTEGYVPVTTMAQQSTEYQDYLSRRGEDNNLYYDIKLDAVQLIIDNVDRTFTTPVFNGSASLRDAAGQLIENVCKSVNRRETVDDAYMDKLYGDVTSLYRLDQLSNSSVGKKDLGPLPTTSVVLLVSLVVIWLFIGGYYLRILLQQRKAVKK